MDRSVKPGDNFFEYANGAWVQRTEIPPDRPGVTGNSPMSATSVLPV
jgi:predicted metalloendopeptidase